MCRSFRHGDGDLCDLCAHFSSPHFEFAVHHHNTHPVVVGIALDLGGGDLVRGHGSHSEGSGSLFFGERETGMSGQKQKLQSVVRAAVKKLIYKRTEDA